MLEFEVTGSVMQPFSATRVVVLGVGGAGCNTVNALLSTQHAGYRCMVVNTDVQALETSCASHKLRIGIQTTKGRGAGADPEVGRAAAEENIASIIDLVGDAELVFLVGGLGGGTGTGAIPVIAQALKERDIITVCVVTKPFGFEGKRRMALAEQAELQLRAVVDTLITIPNEKLMQLHGSATLSLIDAFGIVNTLVGDCVRGVVDIIAKPGHINVDFADVKTVIKGMGATLLGTARARGEDRAIHAAHAAVTSPFLEGVSMRGARNVLINVTGSNSLGLHEIQQAAARVTEDCDEQATIIIGSVIDDKMGDEIAVTVLATGFGPLTHKQSESRIHTQRPPFASDAKTVMTKDHPLRDILYRETAPQDVLHHNISHRDTARGDVASREASSRETAAGELSLRDLSPALEKRLREQYALSQEELEVPTLLRKLLKEQAIHNK